MEEENPFEKPREEIEMDWKDNTYFFTPEQLQYAYKLLTPQNKSVITLLISSLQVAQDILEADNKNDRSHHRLHRH